ncbi:hypothetical protein AK812_SmicGene16864 [Symbiodinium microadriaticum]|uniref:Uncharacterized protein n=1 Tax=Symbiodinium microadriaticum TaxID=2951 RepID=A0A1Q9DZA2_SYMMI|nr:hypothetical protein AK812_SmicGene16864 [Symbiodinium microadriaticum]
MTTIPWWVLENVNGQIPQGLASPVAVVFATPKEQMWNGKGGKGKGMMEMMGGWGGSWGKGGWGKGGGWDKGAGPQKGFGKGGGFSKGSSWDKGGGWDTGAEKGGWGKVGISGEQDCQATFVILPHLPRLPADFYILETKMARLLAILLHPLAPAASGDYAKGKDKAGMNGTGYSAGSMAWKGSSIAEYLDYSPEMAVFRGTLAILGKPYLEALSGYFSFDHLCRIIFGTNLLLVPCYVLGMDCGVLQITSVTLTANCPAHTLRRAMYSSGTYQAVGIASAMSNLSALGMLLKAAYLDGRLVPVAVLPACKKMVVEFLFSVLQSKSWLPFNRHGKRFIETTAGLVSFHCIDSSTAKIHPTTVSAVKACGEFVSASSESWLGPVCPYSFKAMRRIR